MSTTPEMTEHLLELVRRASTILPRDIVAALSRAKEKEKEGSAARAAIDTILENVEMAREHGTPICQDTGTPIFTFHHPVGASTRELRSQAETALARATESSYLRPNAVHPLTGKNSGNNVGLDYPTIDFVEWDNPWYEVSLTLKGGGSENVSGQLSLPNAGLGAGRDVDGIRKAVLKIIMDAQGKGCAPGVIGVAVGGDRGSSYKLAKKQLSRSLDDKNDDQVLAELEETLLKEANSLSIGPMGFGGATTVLGVKIGVQHRLPASFFVSVAYMCWACRRATMTVKGDEVSYD